MIAKQVLEELRGDMTIKEFAQALGISSRMLKYIYDGDRRIGSKTMRGLLIKYPERTHDLTKLFLSQGVNKGTHRGTNI